MTDDLPAVLPDAGQLVTQYLHEQVGLDHWLLLRRTTHRWVPLAATGVLPERGDPDDEQQPVDTAACNELLLGPAGAVSRLEDLPAYLRLARPPVPKDAGAVRVPLRAPDGSVVATLVGLALVPPAEGLAPVLLRAEQQAKLLELMLAAEWRSQEALRRAERAEAAAQRDALTGVWNRRGWDRLLAAEEERCRRHGHPAEVLVVDLDGLKAVNDGSGHDAGDALLVRAAQTLRRMTRDSDVVARVGGDEFVVLAVETGDAASRRLRERIVDALREAGVPASVGSAARAVEAGLPAAWRAADARMYDAKRSRRSG